MLDTSKLTITCLSIVCCLVLLSGMAHADGKWFVTDEGYRYYDNVTFDQTASWTAGADAEGRVHGEGTMRYFKEGVLYCTFQGTFVNGVIQGKGSMTWTKGIFYEGQFLNGEFHGKGYYKVTNGIIYEGDFTNSKFNGKGSLRWPNGNVYEGDIVNGKLMGKGVLRYKEGFRYEGDFLNNKIQGYGTLYGPDNKIIYQGNMPVPTTQPNTGNTPPPLLQVGDVIKGDEFQKSDGSLTRLEYSQKPTILWFWAGFTLEKWLAEMFPVLQSVHESRGDKVNVYAVNFGGDWEKISDVMSRYGCFVPALKSQNNLRYSHGFPCIIIIDKEGTLRYKNVGSLSLSELNAIIDSL